MKKLTYKDQQGNIIAEATGKQIHEAEGNYYLDPETVKLDQLAMVPNSYHCPIKNSDADYYYLKDENGEPVGQEACWLYKSIPAEEFKHIEGKVGFYRRSTTTLTLEESEV